MKNGFSYTLLLFAAMLMFSSCEKYNDEESGGTKEDNSTLIIRTRAVSTDQSGEETKVSYPVNIYVFDSSWKCAAVSTINKETDMLELRLPEGNYEVYAIAGADADTYELPSKDNAAKEAVVSIREGKQYTDLMTAYSTVNLSSGEENKLTLTLNRKVMMLENITIDGVPTSVSSVSVTISPLHKNIRLDGSYDGNDGVYTLPLKKQADGSTWKNDGSIYLLEAAGPATIKVSLTTSGSTVSYSYSSNEELKANYRINISGTYTGNDLTLKGVITGAAWNGVKNINFSFNGDGTTSEDSGTGEGSGSAPAVGTEYNGCYVLMSEKNANGTRVVLLANWSKNGLSFEKDNQTSMKEAIDNAFEEVETVEGVSGWRLPDAEEKSYITANLTEINANLDKYGMQRFGWGSSFYYFMDENGDISSFAVNTGVTNPPAPNGKSFILRAFATVLFTD